MLEAVLSFCNPKPSLFALELSLESILFFGLVLESTPEHVFSFVPFYGSII